ncbi:MAG: DUF63 family protein [Methanomassiliicoccales archaeon]
MSGILSERLASIYRRRKAAVWATVLLLPVAVLVVGSLLLPEIFWDDFLYRYFWGPLVSDVEGEVIDGIAEGYNVVNTVVYALLLAGALFLLYKGFERLGIRVDAAFVLSTVPVILFGGITRALEDAHLFQGGIAFLFISPFIYLVVIALFLMGGVVGYLIVDRRPGRWGEVRYFALFIALLLVLYYLGTCLLEKELSHTVHPLLPAVAALLGILAFHLSRRWVEPFRGTILCTGLFALLVSATYAVAFSTADVWQSFYIAQEGGPLVLRPWEGVIIPGIALAITAGLGAAGRLAPRAGLLALPLNLGMFFAHLLDGAATYRGVDLYGYGERHVLPTALIDLFDTAAVMLLLKLALVLLLILLIDVMFREDLRDYPGLPSIMKFAVIFLGMAPGTRNLVRIAMGV